MIVGVRHLLKDRKQLSKASAPTGTELIDGAYRFLGVQQGSPEGLVKSVYRAKAKHFHPDAGGDQEQFKMLEKAYRIVLEDTRARKGRRT